MRVMRKCALSTVHRAWYGGKTWCCQSGWKYDWTYWDAITQDGVPVLKAGLRLCRKCFAATDGGRGKE